MPKEEKLAIPVIEAMTPNKALEATPGSFAASSDCGSGALQLYR